MQRDSQGILKERQWMFITQIGASWKKQAAENRRRLVPIIETVHYCTKQGLAFRAHRNHGPLLVEEPAYNDVNFRASVRLRLQAGDANLSRHLSTCPKNSTFLIGDIHNQIINAAGGIMRDNFVRNINTASFFTLINDGTTDTAIQEQMSLVLR